ncbi:putative Dihydrolipoyl dehydrogenase [Paratrimastix pyriformis]|uniref:Dihydrolipoyl dehydrogenase n=1 Tax=Paratrimastix pyriformis TaxID=342808 RepID=A0ABQ8USN6_9EUKA|nr:putative Dihydrolipoyl dehydrogenase [Paratrimastix pyriformis]
MELFGLGVQPPPVNLRAIVEKKNATIALQHHQLAQMLEDTGEKKRLRGRLILIATGSFPVSLPHIPIDGKRLLFSEHIMDITTVPRRLLIVGAGVIGLEMGTVYARLGSQVTFVEILGQIGGNMDQELASRYQAHLEGKSVHFYCRHAVTGVDTTAPDHVSVRIRAEEGVHEEQALEADIVLVCVGRRPFSEKLHLDRAGVTMDRHGAVEINEQMQTNVPHIYSVGDTTPGPMLAHKAEEEAVLAVEAMNGRPVHLHRTAIPCVVYTRPELAWVGRTESDLQKDHIEFQTERLHYNSNSRDVTGPGDDGLMKTLYNSQTKEIYGVHIYGNEAGDLIAEAVLAMLKGVPLDDFGNDPHAHPFFKSFRFMRRVLAHGR